MELVGNNHDVYLLVARCQLASKHGAGSAHLAAWMGMDMPCPKKKKKHSKLRKKYSMKRKKKIEVAAWSGAQAFWTLQRFLVKYWAD